ncbi:acyl-CoA reductase [Flavobacteriaceae bacterium]|nr:acyl-CoA reductase [Flavobacteriaceae bacterium]
MNINRRIQLISDIGEFLKNYLDENYDNNNDDKLVEFKDVITKAQSKNPWFTDANIKVNLTYWSKKLTKHNLNKWLNKYNLNNTSRKNIAIIMAGNIPLVGFHDFICVFLSGHNSIIKLSNSDNCIIPFLTDLMKLPSERIVYSDSFLKDYDGVIATGSDNTSRYFDYYFKNKRSIIRKNRNSIAILNGEESDDDLKSLSQDIFTYFGLGCRNVSKLYVPKNYNFDLFFNSIFCYKELINNHKYANNYDYNKAIYLMSEYKFLDNGFFIVKEGNEMHSPISTINFEYYDKVSILKEKINLEDDNIQCIVSNIEFKGKVNFGETQNPSLNQYADNIDVMRFLLTI